MIRRIHHVAIVVSRLAEAYRFYRDTLGLPLRREAELRDQGVRAALLAAGDSEIELLEPLAPDSGVGRFLAKRGEGLHHLCFETPDVDGTLARLRDSGVEVLDAAPRPGLAGRIAFLHPRACAGILTELATPPPGDEPPASSSLQLKRLVIGAREPRPTAARLQALFGLSEVAMNGGPRIMLGVARGSLLVVPADEVGGHEGLVALSLVAEDFPTLMAAFDRDGTRLLRGTGEVTIEPEASHGVHLHITRYW
ncbi:MAG: methylmalonyl-CoA epimerase [Candidatus Rokubacteria bacterium]|nr:methylmalonyl-CoA epimerase [Candidatus Rokubacteria bacterium]MBI3826620.1 methylmalonyl-CoA epimerase [Candidatus Rokubacteria bacterium]